MTEYCPIIKSWAAPIRRPPGGCGPPDPPLAYARRAAPGAPAPLAFGSGATPAARPSGCAYRALLWRAWGPSAPSLRTPRGPLPRGPCPGAAPLRRGAPAPVRRPGGPPAVPLGPCAPLRGSAGARSGPLRSWVALVPLRGSLSVALRSVSGSPLRSAVRRGAPPPSCAARGSGPGACAALRAAPGGLRPRGPLRARACAGLPSGGGLPGARAAPGPRLGGCPCAPPPRRPRGGSGERKAGLPVDNLSIVN